MTLAATSEQLKTLDELFAGMADDAVDSWLGPYGVEDWDELHRDQADELIRDMQTAPAEADGPPADWIPEPKPEPEPEAKSPAPAGEEDGPVEYCTVDGKRLTLTGDLAIKWREFGEAIRNLKAAEIRARDAMTTLANRSPEFRRETGVCRRGERWHDKEIDLRFTTAKYAAPYAPCPDCIDKPKPKCIRCGEIRFVSRSVWNRVFFEAEKQSVFDALGAE